MGYNSAVANNCSKITYEMALSQQMGDIPDEMNTFFFNMSDIGRYVCWDECGLANGIVDSIEEAKALSAFYAWSWLEGGDPAMHKLPTFYGNEQINWVAKNRMHKPAHVGMLVKFSPNKHLDTMLLMRTETGWKPANKDDILDYCIKHQNDDYVNQSFEEA